VAAAIRLHLQGTPIPGNHTLVNIHSDEYDSSLHELNREVWGNLTVPAAREVSLSFERAVATHSRASNGSTSMRTVLPSLLR
jgi:hypothetical protein